MYYKLASLLMVLTVAIFSGSLVHGQPVPTVTTPQNTNQQLTFVHYLCNGEEMNITCPDGFAVELLSLSLIFEQRNRLPTCTAIESPCTIILSSGAYAFEDHSSFINQIRSDIYGACHNKTHCYFKTPNATDVVYTTAMYDEHSGDLDGGLCGAFGDDYLVQVGVKAFCTELEEIITVDYQWPQPSTGVSQTNRPTTPTTTTTTIPTTTTMPTTKMTDGPVDPATPSSTAISEGNKGSQNADGAGLMTHSAIYMTLTLAVITTLFLS